MRSIRSTSVGARAIRPMGVMGRSDVRLTANRDPIGRACSGWVKGAFLTGARVVPLILSASFQRVRMWFWVAVVAIGICGIAGCAHVDFHGIEVSKVRLKRCRKEGSGCIAIARAIVENLRTGQHELDAKESAKAYAAAAAMFYASCKDDAVRCYPLVGVPLAVQQKQMKLLKNVPLPELSEARDWGYKMCRENRSAGTVCVATRRLYTLFEPRDDVQAQAVGRIACLRHLHLESCRESGMDAATIADVERRLENRERQELTESDSGTAGAAPVVPPPRPVTPTPPRVRRHPCRKATSCARLSVDPRPQSDYCRGAGKPGYPLVVEVENQCDEPISCRICAVVNDGKPVGCRRWDVDVGQVLGGSANTIVYCGDKHTAIGKVCAVRTPTVDDCL